MNQSCMSDTVGWNSFFWKVLRPLCEGCHYRSITPKPLWETCGRHWPRPPITHTTRRREYLQPVHDVHGSFDVQSSAHVLCNIMGHALEGMDNPS